MLLRAAGGVNPVTAVTARARTASASTLARMPSPTARAAAVRTWDANASRYARQTRWQLRALWAAATLADARPEDRTVDVGTGTGLLLDMLRVRPQRPAQLVAIDRSPAMLDQIGPLPEGWTALPGDVAALPLADGAADVACCTYVLQLLDAPTRATALAELHRVLVPGGRLVTVTPYVPDGAAPTALGRALLDGAATLLPARLGGLRTHDPRADLARAGFAVRRAVYRRHGYPSLVVLAVRR